MCLFFFFFFFFFHRRRCDCVDEYTDIKSSLFLVNFRSKKIMMIQLKQYLNPCTPPELACNARKSIRDPTSTDSAAQRFLTTSTIAYKYNVPLISVPNFLNAIQFMDGYRLSITVFHRNITDYQKKIHIVSNPFKVSLLALLFLIDLCCFVLFFFFASSLRPSQAVVVNA